MDDELTERTAQAAYESVMDELEPHPNPWSHVSKYSRDTWRTVARAVITEYSSVPDDNEMNRGFGNCTHCRAPRVAHCHECLNDIERDAAHAAGWRMDHLSGYGCIAVCPDCRNDNTKEDS